MDNLFIYVFLKNSSLLRWVVGLAGLNTTCVIWEHWPLASSIREVFVNEPVWPTWSWIPPLSLYPWFIINLSVFLFIFFVLLLFPTILQSLRRINKTSCHWSVRFVPRRRAKLPYQLRDTRRERALLGVTSRWRPGRRWWPPWLSVCMLVYLVGAGHANRLVSCGSTVCGCVSVCAGVARASNPEPPQQRQPCQGCP